MKTSSEINLRAFVLAAFFSCTLYLFPVYAAEINYPNKIVTMVNPFGPGGGVDITFRPIIDILPDYLGQKIIMSHKPGAAGATAAVFVTKAKPDGYTLLAGSPTVVTILPVAYTQPYSPDDFVAVGTFAKAMSTLSVRPDAPWKTLGDFVADAKKNPQKFKFSTAGIMCTAHFFMESLNHTAGIKTVHIPFTSDVAAITATMGGHTDIAAAQITSVLPHYSSGTLRVLAVSDDVRCKYMPDVPTLKEVGYDVSMNLWFGILAPKGTPRGIVDKLSAALKKGFEDHKIQPLMERLGLVPFLTSPEEMEKILRQEKEFYSKAVKDYGLQVK
jgi:tripartite-type tricarboxylate transporter receptor subunit TctC